MNDKGVKYQLTIPKDLSEKIEKDIEETYRTKSSWFIKLANEYFEDKEKKGKKFIDLNI